MKESDLYAPIKQFLEAQHYVVKAEVHGCDVLAVRGDEEPVVVELKRSLGLDLLLQAVDRLKMTSRVYVGVPSDCAPLRRRRRAVLKLIRMLGLGLVVVKTGRAAARRTVVQVLLDPGSYQPRATPQRTERLLGEFAARVGDPNAGGSPTRGGIVTAYRQRAVVIGQWLLEHGATPAAQISTAVHDEGARDILYRNVHGWFERPSRGVYDVSPRGRREIPEWRVRVSR